MGLRLYIWESFIQKTDFFLRLYRLKLLKSLRFFFLAVSSFTFECLLITLQIYICYIFLKYIINFIFYRILIHRFWKITIIFFFLVILWCSTLNIKTINSPLHLFFVFTYFFIILVIIVKNVNLIFYEHKFFWFS